MRFAIVANLHLTVLLNYLIFKRAIDGKDDLNVKINKIYLQILSDKLKENCNIGPTQCGTDVSCIP